MTDVRKGDEVDRGILPMPQLFPIEIERLAILAEELGEAQQIVGKILRHGFYSHNPYKPLDGENYEMLERELGDIQAAVQMLSEVGPISPRKIELRKIDKLSRVKKW